MDNVVLRDGMEMTWSPKGEVEYLTSPFSDSAEWGRPSTLIGRLPIRVTKPDARPLVNQRLPRLCSTFEVSRFSTSKRYEEHLAGRWLVGELLEKWGIEISGLEIIRDENRAPSLSWRMEPEFNKPLPSITIGHSEGWAIAALSEPDNDVGIDAEHADREISSSAFVMMARGKELQHLNANPDSAISIWTAKEAVQKALHLGMHLNPRKVKGKWPNPIGDLAVIIPIEKNNIQLETWQYDDLRISLAFNLVPQSTIFPR